MRKENFVYEIVLNHVLHLLDTGMLLPGDKIPSVRKMSTDLGVSRTSVLRAYDILENRCLIESRPQSGYYVCHRPTHLLPEPQSSQTALLANPVSIGDLVTAILEAPRDTQVVPLGAATPGPELYPAKQMHRILSGITKNSGAQSSTYDYPPGNLDFRKQLAFRATRQGCQVAPDDFVLTNGAIEALYLSLLAVAAPGDVIAVESPTYFGILQVIEQLGMLALEVPTHPRDGIELEALEKACQKYDVKACVLMPNFNNPLGTLMPEEHKKALVTLLSKHNMYLIEDDIYGDLYFGATRPKPVKTYDESGRVLLCSSVSKSLSPGLRVGWCTPGPFKQQFKQLKFMTSLATPTLAQMAVSQFFETGGYDKHVRYVRELFASQTTRALEACYQYFPQGTKVTRPQGGYVLWVEFPHTVNTKTLHNQALKQNISITPGELFSSTGQYTHCMRLNCGNVWTSTIENALKTVGDIAKSLV